MLPEIVPLIALKNRSPQMIEFIILITNYGDERYKKDLCLSCGSNKTKFEQFPDSISRKEYEVSGICQKCQMRAFNH